MSGVSLDRRYYHQLETHSKQDCCRSSWCVMAVFATIILFAGIAVLSCFMLEVLPYPDIFLLVGIVCLGASLLLFSISLCMHYGKVKSMKQEQHDSVSLDGDSE